MQNDHNSLNYPSQCIKLTAEAMVIQQVTKVNMKITCYMEELCDFNESQWRMKNEGSHRLIRHKVNRCYLGGSSIAASELII